MELYLEHVNKGNGIRVRVRMYMKFPHSTRIRVRVGIRVRVRVCEQAIKRIFNIFWQIPRVCPVWKNELPHCLFSLCCGNPDLPMLHTVKDCD